jgi:hypothetical protein
MVIPKYAEMIQMTNQSAAFHSLEKSRLDPLAKWVTN